MKIGLIGFGKTGKLVANEIIKDENCKLEWVLRKSAKNIREYASDLLGHGDGEGRIYSIAEVDFNIFFKENFVDIIIDFSCAEAVDEYVYAAELGTRIVSAISNYDEDHLNKLKSLSKHTAVLYSPNITLGINFLMEAAKVLQRIAPYADIEVIEEHYRGKTDVSGTAVKIAKSLGLEQKEHINSIRVGGIIGRHEIVFGLPNQTIRLIHESLDRSAFGQGAIYAANWLVNKSKGLYSMEEVLALSFAGGETGISKT